MPLVSVVIPVYNAQETVVETVQSVLQQTLTDFELIVINDGSTDGSVARLEKLQAAIADPRIQIFSYENGGISTARNRGLERAAGDFITFIDADDLWTPRKLEQQVAALQNSPEAGVAYSWTRVMDYSGQLFHEGSSASYAGDVYGQLLRCNFITSGSNVMMTRAAVASTGIFESALRPAEDWDYYLRLARNWPFVVVPDYQVLYRQTAGSLSTNVTQMDAIYAQVCDRAFQDVPDTVLALKPECLAHLDQYLAQLWIRSLDPRESQREGKRERSRNAAAKLWRAVRRYPRILLESKTQALLIKLAILWLSPASGPKLLKRLSAAKGSKYA